LAFASPQNSGISAELDSIESPELLQGVVSTLSLDKAWAARVFERSDPLTTEEAVQYLTSHLRLKFKHDANVVEVTAMSDDPAEAAAIANQVAEDYEALRQHEAADRPGSVQMATDSASGEVKIKSRAEVPTLPTHPNKRFCYAVAAGLGGMLSVMVASAVEVCLLIARAEDAARELLPSR
jgi:capsular polysaccharide biosynthesis protein